MTAYGHGRPEARERIVDYTSYDYRRVWERLPTVDRYDRVALERGLRGAGMSRVLEIGTGYGRLSPTLLARSREYVGVDFNPEGLAEAAAAARGRGLDGPHRLWLAANAYHLPFAPGTFSVVCLIRVHHHLEAPQLALAEISRVLAPGGVGIVTYNCRSRLRALAHDVELALGSERRRGDARLLGVSSGHHRVRDQPMQHFATDAQEFSREVAASGLEESGSYGVPQSAASRLLPFGFGLWLGQAWPGAPPFSTRWAVVRKPGSGGRPTPWERIFACPACGQPVGWNGPASSPTPCRCGFRVGSTKGLSDWRFVPGGGQSSQGRATGFRRDRESALTDRETQAESASGLAVPGKSRIPAG